LPAKKEIPTHILAGIIAQWKADYGKTFPLYGNDTVRHDISGSVRPLLSSTELPHERILADNSGVPKKTILRIVQGEDFFVSEETAEKLLVAMERTDCWWVELVDYY
jgi:hypothetical protein